MPQFRGKEIFGNLTIAAQERVVFFYLEIMLLSAERLKN